MFSEATGVYRASGRGSTVAHSVCEMSNPRQVADWRVGCILRFIDTQGGKLGWDLNQLCAQLELGISGSHAAKLFRRHTGIGVRQYAKQQRLTLAAQQLRSTTDSVKHIALERGYRTPNDLRRQFKKLFSLNPTEFRKAYRKAVVPKRTGAPVVPINTIRFGRGKA
jgi:AraC-like DNA-binding protein